MSHEIRKAAHRISQAIEQKEGPIFSEADWGRLLLAFLEVCSAVSDQDGHFKAKAAEAKRIERQVTEAQRKREAKVRMKRLIDELGSWKDD